MLMAPIPGKFENSGAARVRQEHLLVQLELQASGDLHGFKVGR